MTKTRTLARLGCAATVIAAAFVGVHAIAAAPAGDQPPAFSERQPETFHVPGSLSNAWADFDRDGDLDLAVSLKSGEIRLYRNDAGTLVDIGAAVGLPRAAPQQKRVG